MTWPGPDLRTGTTFQLITDTHFGAAGGADWLQEWFDRALVDILGMSNMLHGRVDTGDCIHWDNAADYRSEDAAYVAWRDAIIADGLPFALTAGNHDLDSFDATQPLVYRSSAQWAQDVAWSPPGANNVTDIGDVRILSFAPDAKPTGMDGWFITDDTVDWLDQQLSATDRPCFLADHCPMSTQFPSGTPDNWSIDTSSPRIVDVIGAHENAVGILNGHLHVDIANLNHFRTLDVGGRTIFAVNGPPAGGGRLTAVAYADHQWQNVFQTMVLTYDDATRSLTARWRDHLRWQWTTSKGDLSRTITLP